MGEEATLNCNMMNCTVPLNYGYQPPMDELTRDERPRVKRHGCNKIQITTVQPSSVRPLAALQIKFYEA